MPLQQQNIVIPFRSGLDLKTDPYQVTPPKLQLLQNGIFTQGMSLEKRNGYLSFSTNIFSSSSSITQSFGGASFQGELLNFDGNTIYSLNQTANSWVAKGPAVSASLSVESVSRGTVEETTQDSAYHPSGYYCYVWETVNGAQYSIIDSETDQIVTANILISGFATEPKVLALGNYFFISFVNSSNHHLQYYTISVSAIPLVSPVGSLPNITSTLSTTNPNYDCTIINGYAYFAWNSSTSNTVQICYFDRFLTQSSTTSVTAHDASGCISVVGDASANIWLSYYNNTNIYYTTFLPLLAGTYTSGHLLVSTSGAVIRNLTAIVQGSVGTFYYERAPDSDPSHNLVAYVTANLTGTSVSSGTGLLRSVGLFAKPFLYNNQIYVGVVHQSPLQPTYFIVHGVLVPNQASTGTAIVKIGYQNAGGLTTYPSMLAQINKISDTEFQVAYLIKDLEESQSGNIYSQTGVNGAFFNFNDNSVFSSVTLGNNLLITGGVLSMYDGVCVVEHGFFLYPEEVSEVTTTSTGGIGWGVLVAQPSWQYSAVYAWTDNQGNTHRSAPSIPITVQFPQGTPLTFTGTIVSGSPTMTSVSSTTGLFVGQVITDSTTSGNLQASTSIKSIDSSSQITLNLPASGSGSGDTFSTSDTNKAVVTVNCLNITQKYTPNTSAIIELYRTVANEDIFYLVTSITSPNYNDPTAISINITDTTSDLALIGNQLLYTTGGVLENICAPATNIITTYANRVMLVEAEDPNNIWYSQQVVPGNPVSFNDSLTEFIDPRGGFVTAIYNLDDKFIIYKENSIFYHSGQGPTSTGALNDFTTPFLITTDCGSTNQNSIVTMPLGLMFQSPKGIYLLSRALQTQYIGAEVEAFNSEAITSGVLITNTNQVRFTSESGTCLMYDYFYQQWSTFTNHLAVDSLIFEDLFTYFRPNGQVYQETPGQYTDNGAFIPLVVTTAWLQFAGLQGYQRVYKVYILGKYLSPHQLQISAAYNFNPGISQNVYANASSIISSGNIFGQGNVYGQNGIFGGSSPTEQWRFDLALQKCQSIQITLQDVQTQPYGAGLTLSGLSIIAGVKMGLNKVAPSQIVS